MPIKHALINHTLFLKLTKVKRSWHNNLLKTTLVSILALMTLACEQAQVFTPAAPKSEIEHAFATKLNGLKGKVVLVDFWASWCTPCKKSFPWLNQLSIKHANDLVILSVNVDNDKSYADKFLATTPADFDIFYDPDYRVAKQYNVQAMPMSYLVNREGKIVWSHRGFNSKNTASYEAEINKALAE